MNEIGAFAIILDRNEKVLLSHRNDLDIWNLPGGGVETCESPWEAVIREDMEEVGLKVEVDRLVAIYSKPKRDSLSFYFICSKTGGQITESSEADKSLYFAIGDIPKRTIPGHIEVVIHALGPCDNVALLVNEGPSTRELIRQGKL